LKITKINDWEDNESYEEEYEGRRVITQTKVYKNKLLFVFFADDEKLFISTISQGYIPCEILENP
jgi:hypothetical protein